MARRLLDNIKNRKHRKLCEKSDDYSGKLNIESIEIADDLSWN